MNAPAAAPWRRLAPLAVLVIAAHGVLLQSGRSPVRPARPAPSPFLTRSIAAPTAAPAPAPPGPAPATAPALATAPAPATALLPPKPVPAPPRAQARPPPAAQGAAALPRAAPAPPPPRGPAHAFGVPQPTLLHYEVIEQKGEVTRTGQAEFEWRHDGASYEARMQASGATGTRTQRSTGRITDQGLVPGYFSERTRSEQATHFDRPQGRIVFSNNRPDAPLAEGMQDRLSVIVQVAALVAGQPAKFPPGSQLAIPTASTRDAGTWVFTVEAEEDLALPGGAVSALKLQRQLRGPYDQKLELWLAPRMDYAPVRLRLTNPDGRTVDQRWSSTDKG